MGASETTASRAAVLAAIAALYQRGREAWPRLDLPEADFTRHVEVMLTAEPDLVTGHAELHAGDLYLGVAALHGIADAAEHLVELVRPTVEKQLRVMRLSTDDASEITQTVSVRLLVGGKGTAPGLASYNGSTPLPGYAKVIAARLALNWNRDESLAAEREAEAPMAVLSWQADAAAELEKSELAALVKPALQAALDSLDPKSRLVLRLHFVDGVSVAEIARVLSANRATVGRWLVKAREDMLAGARTALVEKIPAEELPDVLATLASRLDLSLARALGGG
jgi:RNA polymerase sigma-70 factor (ECF subfamily)